MCRNLSLEVNTLCGQLPKAITKTFDGRLNCTCIPSTEIDGLYTPWSEWSVCSDTCGNGVQIRSRSCTAPPQRNGGMDCSHFGPPVEVKQCILGQCPKMLPLLRNFRRSFQVNSEMFFFLLLTCEQRFLPCMDFSIHVVVRVACQSHSWFVCAATEKRREPLLKS